ncbi:MAG: diaminohydroxyphosphoribosylaminopyrimidine deaminase [Baekduia sp.]|nr:diaminohydroxyphosphoribosylaminopyrimidine deaminase [Baekduia sp.]
MHPNPVVGAVVVKDGVVVGEGWHAEYGGPHAEVNAIADAGDADLTGATIYVSLEPCCHQGKTPPCTDAILEAGITRVVVAADDPTEKAAGRGLGILRDEGVTVDVAGGELAARARLANQAFRKHARTGRPWVLFKSAMTLDGKVATRTGDSKWISSDASRALAHKWRASVDAVVVGIGTALADDPQLTARLAHDPARAEPADDPQLTARVAHDPARAEPADDPQRTARIEEPGQPALRQPRRVVFDATGRLPLESQLVTQAPEIPLTVVVSRAAPRSAADALQNAGADVIVATGEHEPARVRSALDQLGEAGIHAILLEGGPHLAGAFLDAGEIDEVRLFLAPLLLGGSKARDPLEGEGVERISEALRALTLDCKRVGDDVLISARLREW